MKDPFHPSKVRKCTDPQLAEYMNYIHENAPYARYPKDCFDPYSDGYLIDPPKRSRTAYAFFQTIKSGDFKSMFPDAERKEINRFASDQWAALPEEEKQVFYDLVEAENALADYHAQLHERSITVGNAKWQPMRRCMKVLDKLSQDGFSSIFQTAVDLDEFPDYADLIENPIDLGKIRERLDVGKFYKTPDEFARDIRKVWKNCKIYNQHGTPIWYVADYMEKLFERLFQAWVLSFKDSPLVWSDERSRPWEPTCRGCDGKCKALDSKLIVCDHCDANYNISCLRPRLQAIPTGKWHCPRCRNLRTETLGSAAAEAVSRQKAEADDVPTQLLPVKYYLVKWKGLGYADCSWEKIEDIADNEAISAYLKDRKEVPDEPLLNYDIIERSMQELKDNFGDAQLVDDQESKFKWGQKRSKYVIENNNDDMKLQMYSQAKALQFAKFDMPIPDKIKLHSGMGAVPEFGSNPNSVSLSPAQLAVNQCVNTMVDCVAFDSENPGAFRAELGGPSFPSTPCSYGEFDIVFPVESTGGLGMTVGSWQQKFIRVVSFTRWGDKVLFAERCGKISNNDCIIACNGISCIGLRMKEFLAIVSAAKKGCNYMYFRFLKADMITNNHKFNSLGVFGRTLREDILMKLKQERLSIRKNKKFIVEELENTNASNEGSGEGEENEEDGDAIVNDSDGSGSEGEGEDEDAFYDDVKEKIEGNDTDLIIDSPKKDAARASAGDKADVEEVPPPVVPVAITPISDNRRSIFDICGIDVGDSSDDEESEESCLLSSCLAASVSKALPSTLSTDSGFSAGAGKAHSLPLDPNLLPVKKREFSSMEPLRKAIASMVLTNVAPDAKLYARFPLKGSKKQQVLDAEAAVDLAKAEAAEAEAEAEVKAEKGRKVKQLDKDSEEVVRIWESIAQASVSLNIPAIRIKRIADEREGQALSQSKDMDADVVVKKDTAGGYVWIYAEDSAVVTVAATEEEEEGMEMDTEFWKKLYNHENPHKYKGSHALRDYQVDGLNWLLSCYYKRHGCILADEMGLGKTVQIVTYLEHLVRVENIEGPFLIVVPLSTIEHWRREFSGWTDTKVCIYHDKERRWRDVMREYEWYYADRPKNSEYLKFNVLVTTYDTLIGDFDVMEDIPFRCVGICAMQIYFLLSGGVCISRGLCTASNHISPHLSTCLHVVSRLQ